MSHSKHNAIFQMKQYSENRMSTEEVDLIYEHIYGNKIKSFHHGEYLYKQDAVADEVYVVKTGKVELFVEDDSKTVVFGVVNKGDMFAESEVISGNKRYTSARAQCFTEVYVVNREKLLSLLKQSHPIVRKVNQSMRQQLNRMRDNVVECARPNHPLVSLASVMSLLSSAANSSDIALTDINRTIKDVASFSPLYVDSLLAQLKDFSLVDMKRTNGQVYVRVVSHLLERTKKIVKSFGDALDQKMKTEFQAIDLQQAAQVVDVDASALYAKIRQGKLPDSVFLIRQAELMQLMHERGVQYFRGTKQECEQECDDLMGDLHLDELLDIEVDYIEKIKRGR